MITICLIIVGKLFLPHFCQEEVAAIYSLGAADVTAVHVWRYLRSKLWR